jgi:hypothetical protein
MSGLVPVAIAAAVIVFAVPAGAQQVAFHGAWVEASAAQDVASVPSVVNPPGNAPEQDGETGNVAANSWGISLWSVYNAAPCDVAVRSGTMSLFNCNYVQSSSAADVSLGFPVQIPTGAVVQYARIYFNETVLVDSISAGFWKTDQFGVGTLIASMSPTATTVGNTFAQFGPFSEVIDNAPNVNTYNFLAITSGATRIYKMMVYYKLQVSPAPGAATFTDVPTSSGQFAYVEALVAAGITSGCGAGFYCPDSPVTRGQMAVFLSKALGLAFQY